MYLRVRVCVCVSTHISGLYMCMLMYVGVYGKACLRKYVKMLRGYL